MKARGIFSVANDEKATMKSRLYYGTIAVIAALVAAATVLIPQKVENRAGLEAVRCGYPVAFLTEHSRLDPPSFPLWYHCGNLWEHPSTVSWPAFVLSWLIVFMTLVVVRQAMRSLQRRQKKE